MFCTSGKSSPTRVTTVRHRRISLSSESTWRNSSMRMRTRADGVICFVVLLGLGACEHDRVVMPPTGQPTSDIFRKAISEPIRAATDASNASAGDIVYVAFAAGDLPGVQTVRVS